MSTKRKFSGPKFVKVAGQLVDLRSGQVILAKGKGKKARDKGEKH